MVDLNGVAHRSRITRGSQGKAEGKIKKNLRKADRRKAETRKSEVGGREGGVISPSSSFAIEDEDVWQALIHEVNGHGQGLEVGRNGDLASFRNLAFEFFS